MFTYIKNKYNLHPEWASEVLSKDPSLLESYIDFDSAPYLKLPETVVEFYKMHGHKFWYNINRAEKLFLKDFGPLNFVVSSDKKLLLRYLPKIQELFSSRWDKVYTSLEWKTREGFKKYQDAMIDLAASGNGEIALLINNDNVLAYAYSLLYEKNYYFFQHAVNPDSKYRKYSLGKILIKRLIEDAIQRKFLIFDFMTGSHSYKKEWADKEKIVYIRVSENKNIRGYLKFLPKVALYRIRSLIHRHKKFEMFLKNFVK